MLFDNPYPPSDPEYKLFENLPKNDAAEAKLDAARFDAAAEATESWKWILEPNQEIQEAHERGVEREIGTKPHTQSPNRLWRAIRKPALQNSVEWAWILPPKEKEEYVQRKTKEFFEKNDSVDNNHVDSVDNNWQHRRDVFDLVWTDDNDPSIESI